MPNYAGQFEFLAPGRGAASSGACEVAFDAETLTLVAPGRPPIALDLGDIEAFAAGEHEIRLSLYTGDALRLFRLAKAFQDLHRELLEAWRDRVARCLLVGDLDEVVRLSGRVRLDGAGRPVGGPAEIRLYETNLAVLPDEAAGFQWRLADLTAVEFDAAGHQLVLARGAERLVISRLARRTGELVDLVRSRIAALDERSARTLHALFPFLTPGSFAGVSALLRDGSCASAARLSALDPRIAPVLHEKVVDPDLRPYVQTLVERSTGQGWYAGFKIARQDRDDAGGESELPADPGGTEIGVPQPAADSETGQGSGSSRDAAVFDAGDGLEVLYWFFFPLLEPGGGAGKVAWEATSRGGRATYLFRQPPGVPIDAAVSELNRGLVALNFRRAPVYLDDRTLQSERRYRHYAIAERRLGELAAVRRAFIGRAIHSSHRAWLARLDALLGA